MNQVCKVNENDIKIIRFLYENKEGLRTKTIQKLTDLKQRVVYKRLDILKSKGLVENIFPIWRLVNGQYDFCATLIKSSNIFELHNISYVVKLIKVPEWWSKRKNYLIRLKEWQFKDISFGKGSSNPYQQLINDNFVIQAYPESLIIIAKKRYYSNNPYETIQNAMKDVLDLLDWFSERFRFKFFEDGVPHIEVRNNDFNRMNDAIANQVRKDKNKFLVELDKRRKVWVDLSEPFGKEANYPEGQEKMEKLTKDILTKESLLPSEMTGVVKENAIQISNLINVITQSNIQLQEYRKQNEVHLKLINEYRKENIRWRKESLEGLKKENEQLKQKRLFDF